MKLKEFLELCKKKIERKLGNKKIFHKLAKNDLQIFIGSILSSNTKDITTNKVLKKISKKIKTIYEFSELKILEIEKLIKPVNYYRNKSRFLFYSIKKLIKEYNSIIPKEREKLMKFPGIGRKIANIILMRKYNKEVFPVDTHIIRLSKKWGISNSSSALKVEKIYLEIIDKKNLIKFHNLLIWWGKNYCKKKSYLNCCEICDQVILLKK